MLVLMVLLLHLKIISGYDSKNFDDTVLFDMNWPGNSVEQLNADKKTGQEQIIIRTAFKEKYKCSLPNIQEKGPNVSDTYEGPSPLELLSPLFKQPLCSYRLESYWTYEICHGRHIRQYHEDREGKKVKLQEYILGVWDKTQYQTLLDEYKMLEKDDKVPAISYKKIDGTSLPYFSITMGNGTQCELNDNKPRVINVIYVCFVHGKHDVFSLKETSTCVYEVIILSSFLCSHPKYKPQESGENQINCLPLEDHPNKPRNLMKQRNEANKYRRKQDVDRIRVEFHPIEVNEKEETTSPINKAPDSLIDTSPVQSFLAGKNCLNGGTGWWKYEFCYGKSVKQYHVEKDGNKVVINLGYFDKEKHIQWLSNHLEKRPKPKSLRNHLSHLYSGGDVCDKTGKPRQTEVKLKCLENASNVNAVSLYLLEPKYCEYILGVESPLICDILFLADENGLILTSEDNSNTEEISTINIARV